MISSLWRCYFQPEKRLQSHEKLDYFYNIPGVVSLYSLQVSVPEIQAE